MDLPEIGQYALLKDRSRWHWNEDEKQWYIDDRLFEAELDDDDITKSEMAKYLGDKVLITNVINIAELPDLIFIVDENDYSWDSFAIDRIVNMEDDPEHFI